MMTKEHVAVARVFLLEAIRLNEPVLFQPFELFNHLKHRYGLEDHLIRRAFWELVGESQVILQPNSRIRLNTLPK